MKLIKFPIIIIQTMLKIRIQIYEFKTNINSKYDNNNIKNNDLINEMLNNSDNLKNKDNISKNKINIDLNNNNINKKVLKMI